MTWIWAGKLRNHSLIPGIGTIFLSSVKRPDQLQGPSRLPGAKQPTTILHLVLRFRMHGALCMIIEHWEQFYLPGTLVIGS